LKLLVTGGAGFVGSNLIRLILAETSFEVVNLDLLTYAGNLDNLTEVAGHPRYRFVQGDICDGSLVRELVARADVVLNLAAESHVDRSIKSAAPFVRTNVTGTETLLPAAVASGVRRFVQVSTDEVYGSLPLASPDDNLVAQRVTEETPLAPRSPYAASKAGGDLLALAYNVTYGLDVVVTRCSNKYGPYQFPEKLVPLVITNAIRGKRLPLYGDGLHVRDWIHVADHCRGILAALERGRPGQVYNFGAGSERNNLWMVRQILEATGADPALVLRVADRPGHDRRYAVDPSKAASQLGWAPTIALRDGLEETVVWYRQNERWWRRVRSGSYGGWPRSIGKSTGQEVA